MRVWSGSIYFPDVPLQPSLRLSNMVRSVTIESTPDRSERHSYLMTQHRSCNPPKSHHLTDLVEVGTLVSLDGLDQRHPPGRPPPRTHTNYPVSTAAATRGTRSGGHLVPVPASCDYTWYNKHKSLEVQIPSSSTSQARSTQPGELCISLVQHNTESKRLLTWAHLISRISFEPPAESVSTGWSRDGRLDFSRSGSGPMPCPHLPRLSIASAVQGSPQPSSVISACATSTPQTLSTPPLFLSTKHKVGAAGHLEPYNFSESWAASAVRLPSFLSSWCLSSSF